VYNLGQLAEKMTTNAHRDEMTLSVVTPTYNQADYLRETIESVLSQDYPRIEYRVIDDGSTDETPQVLAEYTERICWESQANQGQTATINKGWQLATGDVLAWLNSDDTFLPGAVSEAMAFLSEHPDVGIVYGDTRFTRTDGTPIKETHRNTPFDYERFVIECENPIPQPSAFIRRSVIEDVGMLDPAYYYFMDWDLWIRAGLRHKIIYLPRCWSTYRLHAEAKSVSQLRRAAPELEYLYRKFFARDDIPTNLRRHERRAWANMFFTTGTYYLHGGDPRAARRSAFRALATFPRLMVEPRMWRKFLYCAAGQSWVWRRMRRLRQRLARQEERAFSSA